MEQDRTGWNGLKWDGTGLNGTEQDGMECNRMKNGINRTGLVLKIPFITTHKWYCKHFPK